MGYMGLSGISDSDMAADLAYRADKALVAVLRKGLKEKGNSFNTGGTENVALYLEERIKDASSDEALSKLIRDTITAMEKLLTTTKQAEWDDASNKRMHVQAYQRMLKNLKKIPLWDL